VARERLLAEHVLTAPRAGWNWSGRNAAEVDEAYQQALQEPAPDPPALAEGCTPMLEMTYLEGIRDGLRQSMRDRPETS
jgi:hypothetical protein